MNSAPNNGHMSLRSCTEQCTTHILNAVHTATLISRGLIQSYWICKVRTKNMIIIMFSAFVCVCVSVRCVTRFHFISADSVRADCRFHYNDKIIRKRCVYPCMFKKRKSVHSAQWNQSIVCTWIDLNRSIKFIRFTRVSHYIKFKLLMFPESRGHR